MTESTTDSRYLARRVPPLGGFNLTLLGIELLRVLRNRRAIVFTLVLPAALALSFGSQRGWDNRAGSGNVAAYILISMGLYGAALTSSATGANVAMERAQGWSRQLRLTPLSSLAYALVKAIAALVMGALSICAVYALGIIQHKASMPVGVWIAAAVISLFCTLIFSALGVFVGYMVKGENAMQVLGPGLALFSFLGGLFIPLSQYADWVREVAYWTPMYGVAEVARAPLTHELPWYAVVNVLAWFALFIVGAAWRMAKDTDRV